VTSSVEREPRQTLYLPGEVHAQFREIAIRRGHQMSYLLFCWLQTAVIKARLGEDLPPIRLDGPVREGAQLRWRQSRDEYEEWATIFARHDSSVYSVLIERIERYIMIDGDLTLLDTVLWPA
jgi:hypothetical protein